MKKKKLLLRIEEPCRESWEEMEPRALGRHCNSCEKTVINFVGKSDADMLRLVQNAQNFPGSSCGRFTKDQLNREISIVEEDKSPDLIKWLAALLLTGSAGQALGQEIPDSTQQLIEKTAETATLQTDSLPAINDSITDSRFFGKVIGEKDGLALSGVRIRLVGTDLETFSAENGRFSLSIPIELLSDSLSVPLVFSFYSEDFEIESVIRNANELGKLEKIKLKAKIIECFLLGDITVTLGMFVPSERLEPEVPIFNSVNLTLEKGHAEVKDINPEQEADHPGRKALLLPFLQAVLPSRLRRKK